MLFFSLGLIDNVRGDWRTSRIESGVVFIAYVAFFELAFS